MQAHGLIKIAVKTERRIRVAPGLIRVAPERLIRAPPERLIRVAPGRLIRVPPGDRRRVNPGPT